MNFTDLFKDKPLTDDEFEAVRTWLSDNQDELFSPFKEGLTKLVNNEEHKRMNENPLERDIREEKERQKDSGD